MATSNQYLSTAPRWSATHTTITVGEEPPPQFKIGDIVSLKTGEAPIRVWGTRKHKEIVIALCGSYENGMHSFSHRDARDFVMYDPKDDSQAELRCAEFTGMKQTKEEEEPMLYQTTEKNPRFGTKLATNSEGHVVLEMKGENGKVEAFAPDLLEEVVPYTFNCKHIGSNALLAFQCPKGAVAVGDMLLGETNLYRVTKINTKDRSATKEFSGSKLATTPIAKVE